MECGFKWKFIDQKGTFVCENARKINQLYFPVCNEAGMKASVTPYLGGDAKKNQNEFLYLPVSVKIYIIVVLQEIFGFIRRKKVRFL